LRDYETVVIYDPSLDESGFDQQVAGFSQAIEQAGGRLSRVDKWGKRQLAYPIRKKDDGYYAVIKYRCDSGSVRELERRLRLNELVLREMTVIDESGKYEEKQKKEDRSVEAEAAPATEVASEESAAGGTDAGGSPVSPGSVPPDSKTMA